VGKARREIAELLRECQAMLQTARKADIVWTVGGIAKFLGLSESYFRRNLLPLMKSAGIIFEGPHHGVTFSYYSYERLLLAWMIKYHAAKYQKMQNSKNIFNRNLQKANERKAVLFGRKPKGDTGDGTKRATV